MRVIEDAWKAPGLSQGSVLTVGKFDGIHRGQRTILDQVKARAGELGTDAVVVTFEPHPRAVLRPESPLELLTTREQKRSLIASAGIDTLVEISFDLEFSRTTPREFCRDFLVGRLAAREIHVGERFQFGHEREGDLAALERICRELDVLVSGVPEVFEAGEPISSTRIRASLRAGEVELATRMLGRAYSIVGRVARGAGRGRRIGWPTVNIDPANELIPADGVYTTWLDLGRPGRAFESVTNVGTRPTFDDNSGRVIESHLLDFDGSTRSEEVELFFLDRLRSEKKFGSAEELSGQISKDVRAAREYFRDKSCYHPQPPVDEETVG